MPYKTNSKYGTQKQSIKQVVLDSLQYPFRKPNFYIESSIA